MPSMVSLQKHPAFFVRGFLPSFCGFPFKRENSVKNEQTILVGDAI